MCCSINHNLSTYKFAVFLLCNKDSIIPQISFLLHLNLDKFNCFFHLFQNATFKYHILDDIHISANLCLCAVISDKTNKRTRKIQLRIFSKQQNCSYRDLILTILHRYKLLILADIFLRRLCISDAFAVASHKIHINILNGCISYRLILKIAYTLGIHQSHTISEIQLLAFISNTNKRFICLISMQHRTCLNMHQKNMI